MRPKRTSKREVRSGGRQRARGRRGRGRGAGRGRAGYSIVEILVVLSLLTVIAAIAVPRYRNYRKSAYDSAAKSDLHSLLNAQATYLSRTNRYTEITQAGPGDPVLDRDGDTLMEASSGIALTVELLQDGQHFWATARHVELGSVWCAATRGPEPGKVKEIEDPDDGC